MTEEGLYKAQKLLEVKKAIKVYERALADYGSPLYWPRFTIMKLSFEMVLKSLYDLEKALTS